MKERLFFRIELISFDRFYGHYKTFRLLTIQLPLITDKVRIPKSLIGVSILDSKKSVSIYFLFKDFIIRKK